MSQTISLPSGGWPCAKHAPTKRALAEIFICPDGVRLPYSPREIIAGFVAKSAGQTRSLRSSATPTISPDCRKPSAANPSIRSATVPRRMIAPSGSGSPYRSIRRESPGTGTAGIGGSALGGAANTRGTEVATISKANPAVTTEASDAILKDAIISIATVRAGFANAVGNSLVIEAPQALPRFRSAPFTHCCSAAVLDRRFKTESELKR
jgi:hypothetical protein